MYMFMKARKIAKGVWPTSRLSQLKRRRWVSAASIRLQSPLPHSHGCTSRACLFPSIASPRVTHPTPSPERERRDRRCAPRLVDALLPLPFCAPSFYRGTSSPPAPSGAGLGIENESLAAHALRHHRRTELLDRSFGGTTRHQRKRLAVARLSPRPSRPSEPSGSPLLARVPAGAFAATTVRHTSGGSFCIGTGRLVLVPCDSREQSPNRPAFVLFTLKRPCAAGCVLPFVDGGSGAL